MSTDKVQALVVAPHGKPSLIRALRVLRNICGQLSLFAFGSSNDSRHLLHQRRGPP